jgi:secondary thiamine-phosphate synthase enzyme
VTLRQSDGYLSVATRGAGLYEVTAEVAGWLRDQAAGSGLLTILCRHTSASLIVQENADPDVQADLKDFFARLAPEGARLYRHSAEGPDDMPAHIRAALTNVSLSIPVAEGRMALGTWQGIYLFEHRTRGHRRQIALHYLGS